jgi:hypothetical protein
VTPPYLHGQVEDFMSCSTGNNVALSWVRTCACVMTVVGERGVHLRARSRDKIGGSGVRDISPSLLVYSFFS